MSAAAAARQLADADWADADWADDLGFDAEDHGGNKHAHPAMRREQAGLSRAEAAQLDPDPDNSDVWLIPEEAWDELSSYYADAIEAEATWKAAVGDAIAAAERGDLVSACEALTNAHHCEAQYGDDPLIQEIANLLGLEWASGAYRAHL